MSNLQEIMAVKSALTVSLTIWMRGFSRLRIVVLNTPTWVSVSIGVWMTGFVRIWHGVTPRDLANEYERFLVGRAVPDYKSVPGLRKVIFTRRDEGDIAHFLLITIWESLEAMKQFTKGEGSNEGQILSRGR